MTERASAKGQWWIFDLPPRVDPLLVLGLLLGATGVVTAVADHDRYGAVALVFTIVTSVPFALLLVGVVLGTPREHFRGRRSGSRPRKLRVRR